jgi:hypothetical protein
MTVDLPRSVAAASSWQLSDWLDPVKTSQPAAGGTMQIEFRQLDVTEMWLIDRAVIQCNSAADTGLRLYVYPVGPLTMLSGSDTGNFDEAEYPEGLLVRPGQQLVAVWLGATTGAVGTLRL